MSDQTKFVFYILLKIPSKNDYTNFALSNLHATIRIWKCSCIGMSYSLLCMPLICYLIYEPLILVILLVVSFICLMTFLQSQFYPLLPVFFGDNERGGRDDRESWKGNKFSCGLILFVWSLHVSPLSFFKGKIIKNKPTFSWSG